MRVKACRLKSCKYVSRLMIYRLLYGYSISRDISEGQLSHQNRVQKDHLSRNSNNIRLIIHAMEFIT